MIYAMLVDRDGIELCRAPMQAVLPVPRNATGCIRVLAADGQIVVEEYGHRFVEGETLRISVGLVTLIRRMTDTERESYPQGDYG